MLYSKRSSWAFIYTILFFEILNTQALGQKTIRVPSDAHTIQAGIDAASGGDTVLIASGTYYEHIDFKGKAIHVLGDGTQVILEGDAITAPIVTFQSGETRDATLENVIVENGIPGALPSGGGIWIHNASPTIRNSTIRNNKGCGISVLNGAPLIVASQISGNVNSESYFCAQRDVNTDPGLDAGGIRIVGLSPDGQFAQVIGNSISANHSYFGAGGILASDAGRVSIQNNTLNGNDGEDVGAAISIRGNSAPQIIQNLIYSNVINPEKYNPARGSVGPGLNIALTKGSFDQVPSPVVNNTIAANIVIFVDGMHHEANHSGTQVYVDGFYNKLSFSNNIIVGTSLYSALECEEFLSIPTYPGNGIFDHNDIFNSSGNVASSGLCSNLAGANGNISVDPNFAATPTHPYQLQLPSPAIDTGNNNAQGRPPLDILGNPRVQDALGTPASIVDMGVYEYVGIPCTTLCPPPPPPVLPSFTITTTPAFLTLQTQHHVSITITVTPIGTPPGNVALHCSGLPIHASCTFRSQSINVSGADAVSTEVVLDTSEIHGFASNSGAPAIGYAALFTALMFPCCCFPGDRKRSRHLALLVLVGATTLGLSSCSGKYPDSTPPGTYSFTITGISTTSQAQATANVELTVTP